MKTICKALDGQFSRIVTWMYMEIYWPYEGWSKVLLWYQSRGETPQSVINSRIACAVIFFRLNSRWLILIWFTYKTLQYFFSDYFPFKSVFLWRFSWNWSLSASNWSDERHNGFSGRLYPVITISYFADKSLNYGLSGNKWVFPLDVPELIAVQYGAVFTPGLLALLLLSLFANSKGLIARQP